MRGWRAWVRPRGDSAARPLEKEGRREENGGRSAWLARVGAPRAAIPPCGTLGRSPRKARKSPSSDFFPKISPTGLAIPFSRLRVSPAPEMAHLLAAPLVEAVPLLGNRTAQCCVRIAPPSWRGATPTLNM